MNPVELESFPSLVKEREILCHLFVELRSLVTRL